MVAYSIILDNLSERSITSSGAVSIQATKVSHCPIAWRISEMSFSVSSGKCSERKLGAALCVASSIIFASSVGVRVG